METLLPHRPDSRRVHQIPAVTLETDLETFLRRFQELLNISLLELENTRHQAKHSPSFKGTRLTHLKIPETARALGGAFLKLFIGTDLFTFNPYMTLGELTAYRGQSMSNHEIGNRCNSSPRDAKAELGAAIFNNGLDRGVRSVTKLYPPCGRIKQWSDFANEFTRVDYGWQPQRLVGSRRVLLSIQNDIGYHFNDISLLDRAFSLTDFQATQLGYLGDAVLDLLAAEYWLLDDTICEAGQISHMKDVSTTNNLLAIVAVRWRWHQAVTGSAKGTLNGAAKTIAIVDAKRTRKKVSSRWWQKLMIPKGFGDLVESMVGAIYLDAKFDVDKVRPIFDKCIRPVITELLG